MFTFNFLKIKKLSEYNIVFSLLFTLENFLMPVFFINDFNDFILLQNIIFLKIVFTQRLSTDVTILMTKQFQFLTRIAQRLRKPI